MPPFARNLVVWLILAMCVAATVWAVSFRPTPKADFTFVNSAEIQSVDPAVITGQVEGRISDALFEGLTSWDPKTLAPRPGMAESWTISEDKLTYTFKIRPDAKWSDGSPLTAHDFEWSHRRTLDPQTASEYVYQLFYVKNAEKYASGRVEAGDRVEIELNTPPRGGPLHARGEVLKGKFVSVTPPFPKADEPEKKAPKRVYIVEIDGHRRSFEPGKGDGDGGCKQVLLDFAEVGCHALDDSTYEITLGYPTAFFLSLTGMYTLYPVNRPCIDEYGFPEWTKVEYLVTNGPYRLKERLLRERIRLVKSDTYWDREHVKLDTIDALVIESETTALNLYLKGEVDWIPSVPTTIVKQLIQKYSRELTPTPYFQAYFYRINVTRPPLDNPLVRRALVLALDKRAIVESVTRAGETPARSLVPPVIKNYPGFTSYESGMCGDFDPVEAQKLLAQAGYPGGRGLPKIPLLYNSDEAHKMIAELVQRQWKENLGIDVDPQNQEWSAYLAAQNHLDYSICRAGWIGDYFDPATFLGMFVTGGGNNETGWSNARYDELMRNSDREPDPTKRLRLMHDAEEILMRELPIIPVYFGVSKNMVKPYVHGLYGNVLDVHPLGRLSVDRDEKTEFLKSEGSR